MTETLIPLVGYAGKALTLLIIGRVIISWVRPRTINPIVAFILATTEPLLRPVRSILPSIAGMDFSPIVVLFGIQILESVLVRVLISMANNGGGY